MKAMKRIAGILLAVAMIIVMALPAFALTEVTPDTGSILIKNNDTVDASKKTFAAHKILDVKAYQNDEGEIVTYEYSVPASLADFYARRYNLDKTAGDFAMKVVAKIREEADIYQFASDVIKAVSAAPFTGNPVTGEGYKFAGLPLGYYVISDTTAQGDYVKPVSALMLDTITPNVEIEIKAEKPPVDKVIDLDGNVNTTNDRTDTNQAAIGDTVTFVIDSKVPDMTGYKKFFFIVQDTMSKGLTYTNNMVITVGDKYLAENTDFTVETVEKEDGTTEMKIVFKNFLQYNTAEYVGKPISITYTALLNNDAEVNKTPNTNTVKLEYSNDPNVEYDGEDEPTDEEKDEKPLGVTPEEKTETYTAILEIIKTDPIGNRLQGAEFTLSGTAMNIVRVERDVFQQNADGEYWKLTDGTYTTTDPNSTINGAPVDKTKYESETVKYTKTTEVDFVETPATEKTVTGTVSSDGTLRFEGLGAGTFTIKEIKAPEGYNILTEELTVKINWDENEKIYTFEGASDANGVAQVTIINQAGTELPSTGGTGTTIFYIVGSVLVLAAVVLLVSKKRMSANA